MYPGAVYATLFTMTGKRVMTSLALAAIGFAFVYSVVAGSFGAVPGFADWIAVPVAAVGAVIGARWGWRFSAPHLGSRNT